MEVVLPLSLVRKTVDEPWVRVEVEDDGLVFGEDGAVFAIRQTVRMLLFWNQLKEIHDVDETNLQLRKMFAEESCRGQGLVRGDIPTGCHDDIGFLALVVAGPLPDTETFCAM